MSILFRRSYEEKSPVRYRTFDWVPPFEFLRASGIGSKILIKLRNENTDEVERLSFSITEATDSPTERRIVGRVDTIDDYETTITFDYIDEVLVKIVASNQQMLENPPEKTSACYSAEITFNTSELNAFNCPAY